MPEPAVGLGTATKLTQGYWAVPVLVLGQTTLPYMTQHWFSWPGSNLAILGDEIF